MKSGRFCILFLGFFVWISLSGSAAAAGFFDALKWSVSGGAVKTVDAKLYNGLATGAFNDTNLDGNLDPGETIIGTLKLYDRSGRLVLESPANIGPEALEAWALLNADAIFSTIFENDLSRSTGASDDAIVGRETFDARILEKVDPTASEFKGALEYVDVTLNGDDGNAFSAVFGYDWGFDSGMSLGLVLPYRFTDMDDAVNSKSHFAALDFYLKYPVKEWDKLTWNVGADAFGSIFVLTSDAIDLLGNLKYGAGGFTSLAWDLDFMTFSAGADYKISKANVPSGLVDSDNEWVETARDYLNDLDASQTLTYGANLGFPFAKGKAALNLEVVRSHFLASDVAEGRDVQTTALISLAWRPSETFELSLGVHKTYELEEIDLAGVTLGTVFRF